MGEPHHMLDHCSATAVSGKTMQGAHAVLQLMSQVTAAARSAGGRLTFAKIFRNTVIVTPNANSRMTTDTTIRMHPAEGSHK
jgi:hypothetical protein